MSEQEKYIPKITENAHIWFGISGFFLILSLVGIIISFIKFGSPVLLGLDFKGGTKIEYKFSKITGELTSKNISKSILTKVHPELAESSIVQIANKNLLIIRTRELNLDEKELLEKTLAKEIGVFTPESVETISPIIGPQLLWSGLLALIVAILGICIYVSYRFRQDFAICTIIALIHDVFIVVGLFAWLGIFKNIEVNTLFLTACLTVLGFSVHDTIVVFDRIRENMKFLSKKNSFSQIINLSIGQVWFRSFCTSFTVLVVLLSLFLFGGDTTRIFSGSLFTGLLAGTYSSIFVAAILLDKWKKYTDKVSGKNK